MNVTSSQLSHLSAKEQRALLAQLLQKQAQGPKYAPPSFAQERIWFLEQLAPGTAIYNVRTALRLTGPLDVTALRRSLNKVVLRHETLRTTFTTNDDQVVQVVRRRRS